MAKQNRIKGGFYMEKETFNTLKQLLNQQKEDIENNIREELNQQKEDIKNDLREELKQQIKPINGRLRNLEDDARNINKDIKEIRFDIQALKRASLELSKDTINHTHLLNDKETSRAIRI